MAQRWKSTGVFERTPLLIGIDGILGAKYCALHLVRDAFLRVDFRRRDAHE
jgi:hypothetical protein